MNLPPISIPDLSLPFVVPHMVHPLFIHFAIALPVVIILFELINLATKRRSIGVMSFVLVLVLVLAYVGAYLSGMTDGQAAKKALSPEAKQLLEAHKQLGIYLVYGSLVVLFFKLISATVKKFPVRLIFLLILIGFTLMAFTEGKKGGELVYTYGTNVKAASPAPLSIPAKTVAEAPIEKSQKSETPAKGAVEKREKSAPESASKTVKKISKVTEAVKETEKKAAKAASEAHVKPASEVVPVEPISAEYHPTN